KYGERFKLHQSDLFEVSWLPRQFGRFDAAVSSSCLHNLRDFKRIREIYGEICAQLKPGGAFLNADLINAPTAALHQRYDGGATTRGMHESLVTYGGNVAPEVITCSHEEVAVAMAEGYYPATGRPQATLVHNIVGLQHASKAIYEAWLNNAPMIIIGGTGPLD